MKKYVYILLTLFFLQSCSQQEPITAEEVRDVISRFDQGWKAKDSTLVDSVLSHSYMYFTQSGGTFSRNSVVHTAGSPDYKLDSVSRKEYDIKIEGNTAVVNTVWSGRGTYFGKRFKDKQRCSIILVKKDGRVQILSEHCTPIR